MKSISLALGGLAAVLVATPLVDMAVRGTIDDRTRDARRRATPPPPRAVRIPAPRTGAEDGARVTA